MKKRLAIFTSLLVYWPFGAVAHPILIGLIIGAVATLGISIFRTLAPTNLANNIEFFSSCWSCTITSGLINKLSDVIPVVYSALAQNILMVAIGLTIVFYAWRFLNIYLIQNTGTIDGWDLAGDTVRHLIKLSFVGILLFFPLPSFISHNFISPIMNIGFSYNSVIRESLDTGNNTFGACLVATALNDKSDANGGFPPSLRHNIACQIAEFHKLTGIGLSVGWTFVNMAFSFRYGIFPNIFMIFAGILIMSMFFWALVPIPIYFIQTFVKLAFNFIMLPLSLLGWLFNGGKEGFSLGLFPGGDDGGVMKIIKDVIEGTVGVALVGLFTGFSLLFLSAVIGEMNGIPALIHAIETNNSIFLMDALTLNNNGMIDILLIGLFIGMFMNAIPGLIKTLFADIKGYNDAVSTQSAIIKSIVGLYEGINKNIIAPLKKGATSSTPPPTTPAPPGGTP